MNIFVCGVYRSCPPVSTATGRSTRRLTRGFARRKADERRYCSYSCCRLGSACCSVCCVCCPCNCRSLLWDFHIFCVSSDNLTYTVVETTSNRDLRTWRNPSFGACGLSHTRCAHRSSVVWGGGALLAFMRRCPRSV